ncbi:DUF6296 family protein [Kitasatospora sp. NPDC059646]|uniref:DUF6296 family protein n=1 Tax=Kitasatospora sp. NPDC059646 TaxID=3346893 RepID=UPI00367CB067
MDSPHGYRIAVPGRPGSHAPQETVVVYRTDDTTPEGHVVYLGEGGLRVVVHGLVARFLEPYPEGLCHPFGYAYPLGD